MLQQQQKKGSEGLWKRQTDNVILLLLEKVPLHVYCQLWMEKPCAFQWDPYCGQNHFSLWPTCIFCPLIKCRKLIQKKNLNSFLYLRSRDNIFWIYKQKIIFFWKWTSIVEFFWHPKWAIFNFPFFWHYSFWNFGLVELLDCWVNK